MNKKTCKHPYVDTTKSCCKDCGKDMSPTYQVVWGKNKEESYIIINV